MEETIHRRTGEQRVVKEGHLLDVAVRGDERRGALVAAADDLVDVDGFVSSERAEAQVIEALRAGWRRLPRDRQRDEVRLGTVVAPLGGEDLASAQVLVDALNSALKYFADLPRLKVSQRFPDEFAAASTHARHPRCRAWPRRASSAGRALSLRLPSAMSWRRARSRSSPLREEPFSPPFDWRSPTLLRGCRSAIVRRCHPSLRQKRRRDSPPTIRGATRMMTAWGMLPLPGCLLSLF